MTAYTFRGGSLDGAARQVPDHVHTVVTTARGGRSWYTLSPATRTGYFTGHDDQGETMAGIMQAFSAAARREREAIEAASRPVGCPQCGMTFGSPGAHTIAHDGRCLPPGAFGQLAEIDGVWCIPGTDAARR